MKLDRNFWKKYFSVYDTLNYLYPYQELLHQISDELGEVRDKKVLDLGAGTGNLAVLLSTSGARVVGFDFSEEGLEIFKKKLPNQETVYGDLTNSLPFNDGEFDSVCSNNTLYTLNSRVREKVFTEIFRILKPGGKVVVSNLRVGFKPISIYIFHIRHEIKVSGLFKTLIKALKLIKPTLLIFYYNFLIQRANAKKAYNFINFDEQRRLLIDSGFIKVSDDRIVYAGQAILNVAIKPEKVT
jgi:ubiquinone/menaquinone biosynthesis C-methylase UbiE